MVGREGGGGGTQRGGERACASVLTVARAQVLVGGGK